MKNKKNKKQGRSRLRKAACGAIAFAVMTNTMAITAFAAGPTGLNDTVGNSQLRTASNAMKENDVIDYDLRARLTVHKYDMTAAMRGGVDIKALNTRDANGDGEYDRPDGLRDSEAESKLAPYALPKAEFTYIKVGNIATLSNAVKTDSAGRVGGNIEVVYSIPTTLRDLLGLVARGGNNDTNARHIAEDGTCYYTSGQLNKALSKLIDSENTDFGPNKDINKNGHLGKTTQQNTYGKDRILEWLRTGSDIQDHSKYPRGKQTTGDGVNGTEKGAAVFDHLDLGLYMVVETKVPDNVNNTTNPFFVTLPMTSKDGDSWEGKTTENGTTFYDAHVYPKNQTNDPTVDKTVHEESDDEFHDQVTASSGDVLDYRVVIKMPTITSNETDLTVFQIDDVLSKGLSYNGPFQIDFYESNQEAEARNPILHPATPMATWKQSDGTKKFTVNDGAGPNGSASATGGSHAIIKITGAGLQEINDSKTKNLGATDIQGTDRADGRTKFSDKWMVLSYQVKVEELDQLTLGDDGNPNNVTVSYKRRGEPGNPDKPGPNTPPTDPDPANPPTIVTDLAEVYSYGINLKKTFDDSVDATDKGDPRNVKFILFNETDGYYVVADQFKEGGTDVLGKYYVNNASKGCQMENGKPKLGSDGKTIPDRSMATTFVPDADGNLWINGLEADEYSLIETDTDTGYSLLREPIKISVKPTRKEIQSNVAALTGDPNITYDLDENGNIKWIQTDENGNVVDSGIYQSPAVAWSEGEKAQATDLNNSNQHPVPTVPSDSAVKTDDKDIPTANSTFAQPIKPARVTLLEKASAKVDNVDAVMEKLTPKNDADNHASENARVMMSVLNSRGFKLPATGGAGVWALTMTGVFGLSGAVYVLARKHKKNEDAQA